LSAKLQGYEKAILVQIDFSATSAAENLEEFRQLALSAGAQPTAIIIGARKIPEAKYFIGKGKACEVHEVLVQHQIDLVLINHHLSPAQQRELEKLWSCRVLDRSGLILDIFARRARTFEGKLQVELAQLQHLSTRLVRGWTHLERQKGGIGLRGPGETQLETDKRLIRKRIKTLLKRLEKVRKQRLQSRSQRQKNAVPTVSLVGYTNAGKSTLFNSLTIAEVFVQDQLFATLDPTLRRITLPGLGKVVMVDTVGFIRDLPHELVDAFRATLEETTSADLLLHVVDINDQSYREKMEAVQTVLTEIHAETIPQLVVFNKIDLRENFKPRLERNEAGLITQVWVSAAKKLGFDLLRQAIAENLSRNEVHCCLRLKPAEAGLRSKLFKLEAVVSDEYDDYGNNLIEIKLPLSIWQQLQ
jgi:GTPase